MAEPRQMQLVQQLGRTRQLDALRFTRPLTPAEDAEADRLSHRAYMRTWRQQEREAEQAAAKRRRA
jgi:hypothetical protein